MAKKRTLSGGPAEHLAQRIGACKNPEFAQWLREWWEEASKRDANKIQFVYKKAMESMIAHPNPILEVQAAQRLPYIGPTIVSRLERKLAEWKTAGGQLKAISEAPQTTANMPPAPPIPTDALQQTTPSNDRRDAIRKRQKPYIPAFRSGPYAMLIALHLESQGLQSKGYCSRQDILTLGQPYCKVALEEGTYPALRGAIKILEEKGFMTKWGVPTRFCLTDDGADLAAKLWNSGERRSSAPLPSNAGSMATPSKENSRGVESPMDFVLEDAPPEPAISTFTWPPSSFDVFLLVDNREVKSKNDRDYIINRLQEDGIPSELRNLDLGDFLWVARKKVSHRHGGYDDLEEAVLDLVVERKTEDDLVQSIIDGRFLDQKFRLNSSGLDRKIYLVEKFEQVDFRSIGEDRFCAAIVHTQIIDDLNLRYTSGLEDSLRFLCDLHHNIVEQLQNTELRLATSPDFQSFRRSDYLGNVALRSQQDNCKYLMNYTTYSYLNSKSALQTIRDLFIRQLLNIRHMSAEKALAVVSQFPTPILLYEHYKRLPNDENRQLYFKDWSYGPNQRKFGAILSRRVCNLFWDETYVNPSGEPQSGSTHISLRMI